jgi:hypothetical protein
MDEQTPKNSRRKMAAGCGACCGGVCANQCGGWYCPSHFHVARWLLGLLIIVFIFWAGMKFGELKSEIVFLNGRTPGLYGARNLMNTAGYRPDVWMMVGDRQLTPTAETPVKIEAKKQ